MSARPGGGHAPQVAIAWLLRNYQLDFSKPMPADDYTTMVVAPQAPVLVKYQRIQHGEEHV